MTIEYILAYFDTLQIGNIGEHISINSISFHTSQPNNFSFSGYFTCPESFKEQLLSFLNVFKSSKLEGRSETLRNYFSGDFNLSYINFILSEVRFNFSSLDLKYLLVNDFSSIPQFIIDGLNLKVTSSNRDLNSFNFSKEIMHPHFIHDLLQSIDYTKGTHYNVLHIAYSNLHSDIYTF